MRLIRLPAVIVLSMLGLSISHAGEPTAAERFDLLVRDDLFAGFTGDTEALERGLANCEKALTKNPKHAEALVWRGAARVYQSSLHFKANDSVKGLAVYNAGLKDMDTAVALEPKNAGVRIPRASVLSAATRGMPAFMATPLLKTLRNDFETIYTDQKARGEFDKLGKHPRGEVRMGLADAYRRLGELDKSKAQLEAIQQELPGSKYATRADQWLKADPKAKLVHDCIGCHTK